MKENLKPYVYKLWKHYVVAQSFFRREAANGLLAGREDAEAAVRGACISDSAHHEQEAKRIASEGERSVKKTKKAVCNDTCNCVLFVERSGELR